MMSTPRSRPFVLASTSLMVALLLSGVGARVDLAAVRQEAAAQALDFVAVDAAGQPVTDLTAGQVSLKIDGKDRALTSLELVRFDQPASPLPAPFATNAPGDAGREFVLLVDEESLRVGTENPLRASLLAFGAALPARDRIGVFTIPRGATSLSPTTDRAAFRAAVTAVQGRARARMTANERSCHARDVLNAVSSIVTATRNPGIPTPVVLFAVTMSGPSTGPVNMAATSECRLAPNEFQRLGQVAEAARTQFFVVRPDDEMDQALTDGLENVTGVTGGQMTVLGGGDTDALVRIARETSAYYVATFMAEGSERNGASHRVELRTSRPDVTMRARAGVQIPQPDRGNAITPQSMLRAAAVHRGFGLRAMAVSARNDGDTKNPVKLIGLAEPIDPAVSISAAAVGVYDPGGKLVAQWTAKAEELKRVPLTAALVVPNGTYRLRVAAVDALGRAATADYEIDTDLTSAGAAHLGSLLVGTGPAGFAPQLQFTTAPQVIVYFELYGRPETQFGALVEIAETLDGPAVASAQPTPAATPVADKFMFTATLPIAALKPGDYIVRASVGFEGHPTGVLARTIRKR